jgi:2-phosphosulfolactate phosphatase
MKISILHGFDQAHQAQGLTVVIDVFRAFSTACYLLAMKPKKLVAVATIEQALLAKREHHQCLLIGERMGKILPGFDFGNSPATFFGHNFKNKTIYFTTTAGVQGVVGAISAQEVITGSFVNAKATIDYIKRRKPKELTLLCCNRQEKDLIEEDEYCAIYFKQVLEKKRTNYSQILKCLTEGAGKKFFLSDKQAWFPQEDFYLCTKKDEFNFAVKSKRLDHQTVELSAV